MSRTARVQAQADSAEAAQRGIRLWAGRGKVCEACGSDRMTWRIKVTADGELWACECQQTWIEPAAYRVCLSLDPDEAAAVLGALMAYQRTASPAQVATFVRVIDQLMRSTL